MTTIVCLYVECDERDPGHGQSNLETVLRAAGFVFYNATGHDRYTRQASRFPTLEDIEIDLEGK